jgi:hypothetical protein
MLFCLKKMCWLLLFSGLFSSRDLVTGQSATQPTLAARKIMEEMAITASKFQINTQDQIKIATDEIKSLESSYSSHSTKTEREKIRIQILTKKESLKDLKLELKSRIQTSKTYKELLGQSDETIQAYILQHPDEHRAYALSPNANVPAIPEVLRTPDSDPKENIKKSKPTDGVPMNLIDGWYHSQSAIPYQPVTKYPCAFQSGLAAENKAMQPELIFSYTPDEVKDYFKETDYSQGWGFIGIEPGYTYFQLNLEIASEQALLHYGNLGKSFIVVRLINGKEIRLINSRYDSGTIDRKQKSTRFSGVYFIDKNAEKLLASTEVDTMRLNLVTGYEDYTIYNIDFFTRQLACILQSK